ACANQCIRSWKRRRRDPGQTPTVRGRRGGERDSRNGKESFMMTLQTPQTTWNPTAPAAGVNGHSTRIADVFGGVTPQGYALGGIPTPVVNPFLNYVTDVTAMNPYAAFAAQQMANPYAVNPFVVNPLAVNPIAAINPLAAINSFGTINPLAVNPLAAVNPF